MIILVEGSDAFDELDRILHNPDTYKVSIDVRENRCIALKRNEGAWSPTLSCTAAE